MAVQVRDADILSMKEKVSTFAFAIFGNVEQKFPFLVVQTT
jgi:hypothetical protein